MNKYNKKYMWVCFMSLLFYYTLFGAFSWAKAGFIGLLIASTSILVGGIIGFVVLKFQEAEK